MCVRACVCVHVFACVCMCVCVCMCCTSRTPMCLFFGYQNYAQEADAAVADVSVSTAAWITFHSVVDGTSRFTTHTHTYTHTHIHTHTHTL